MKTKTCTGQCGRELPETEKYFEFRKTRNKFRNKCKICRKLDRENYYKDSPWMKSFGKIKQRCDNINHIGYHRYGGRGIECKITEEQLEFLWFRDKAYNMKKPSIDRLDNDGNYELSNCQFIELGENIAKDKKIPVLQYDLENTFINKFESMKEAGKQLNISAKQFSNVLHGHGKTCHGFIWKYKNERT